MSTPAKDERLEPCDYILADNLRGALIIARDALADNEREVYGPTFCSVFRARLESNIAALRAGRTLTIRS